jgi:tetratricopeptide (TPR) repeat protein
MRLGSLGGPRAPTVPSTRVSPATPAPDPQPTPPPPSGSKAPLFIGLALGLVAVLGVVGVFVMKSKNAGPKPEDPLVAEKRAALLTLLGDDPEAPESCRTRDAQAIDRMLDALKNKRTLDGASSAEEWVVRAKALHQTDAPAALDAANRASALCPAWAVPHSLAGNALQKSGKLDEAADAYARALTYAAGWDVPRFNLGLLQMRRKDAAAIATFTELIRRRPDHPNAHRARGQAYLNVERFDEALADFEESLRQNDKDGELWLLVAQLHEKKKARSSAKDAWCRAKELGVVAAAARCP